MLLQNRLRFDEVMTMSTRVLVIVWSGRDCSGTESVTALISSGRNRSDTRYSHLLACSSVIYHSMTLHVTHLPVIRTNHDVNQLFAV